MSPPGCWALVLGPPRGLGQGPLRAYSTPRPALSCLRLHPKACCGSSRGSFSSATSSSRRSVTPTRRPCPTTQVTRASPRHSGQLRRKPCRDPDSTLSVMWCVRVAGCHHTFSKTPGSGTLPHTAGIRVSQKPAVLWTGVALTGSGSRDQTSCLVRQRSVSPLRLSAHFPSNVLGPWVTAVTPSAVAAAVPLGRCT